MDDDAAPGVEITDDGIARQRPTALAETDHRALGTLDQQGLCVDVLRRTDFVLAIFRQQSLGDQRRKSVSQTDIGQQAVEIAQVELSQQRLDSLRRQFAQPADASDQCFFQQPLAEQDRLLAPQVFEVMADAGAGLGGDHEVEPGGIGAGGGRNDHLDGLTGGQRRTQRHQSPVHLGAHAGIADIGVDGVGEVHGGGAARQIDDLAARSEHVDLVGEQIHLDAFQEFHRIAGAALHVQQLLQPLTGALLGMATLAIAGFVAPVRGDANLGHNMHFLGADLHFDRDAVGTEQHRVQRLIAVGLGDGNVVLEPVHVRFVQVMHHP